MKGRTMGQASGYSSCEGCVCPDQDVASRERAEAKSSQSLVVSQGTKLLWLPVASAVLLKDPGLIFQGIKAHSGARPGKAAPHSWGPRSP